MNTGSYLGRPFLLHLVLCVCLAGVSVSTWCAPVPKVDDPDLALVRSLPLIAEPDMTADDGRLVMDESELAVRRDTDAGKWNASVGYAEPGALSIEGNYGLSLSRRHAWGIGFAFARHRKEIVLSEAFAFGRKTQLRIAIGHSLADAGEGDLGGVLRARARAVELRRRAILAESMLELGVAAYDIDDSLTDRGTVAAVQRRIENSPIGTHANRHRGMSASLSLVPRSSALRLDMDIARRHRGGLSITDRVLSVDGYRLRATARMRQCQALDVAYGRTGGISTLAARLDASAWRVSLSAAQSAGEHRATVSLWVAVVLPVEGARRKATVCKSVAPVRLERRHLIDEVTVLPDWYRSGMTADAES